MIARQDDVVVAFFLQNGHSVNLQRHRGWSSSTLVAAAAAAAVTITISSSTSALVGVTEVVVGSNTTVV